MYNEFEFCVRYCVDDIRLCNDDDKRYNRTVHNFSDSMALSPDLFYILCENNCRIN